MHEEGSPTSQLPYPRDTNNIRTSQSHPDKPEGLISPPLSTHTASPIPASPMNKQQTFAILVYDFEHQRKPLNARYASGSFNFVNEHIVNTRLRLVTVDLDRPEEIPYNQGFLKVYQEVQLTWIQPKSDSTDEAKFFLVPRTIINIDVIFGDKKLADDTLEWNAGHVSHLHQQFGPVFAQPRPHGRNPHGLDLWAQDHSLAGTAADDYAYSSSPAGANSPPLHRSSASFGSRERQQPTTPDRRAPNARRPSNSYIPRPSSFAASPSGPPIVDQPRVQSRTSFAEPTIAPSLNQGNSSVETRRVRFILGESERPVTLDLHGTGEAFLQQLIQSLGRIQRTVDRNLHYVLFTTEKDLSQADSCTVFLIEDQLEEDWKEAKKWIRQKQRLYAIIEQDAG
ncbi:MAG: hypothetical protein M1821_003272 [Bathelium mastoideum]|nr:MAG: hypothetical protein M1821_003272 [Bathelium mastoideum]